MKEKFSFSKIDCYDQCHFQYKLKYIDKNFPKGGSLALDLGTAIHKCEEDIATAIKNGLPIDYTTIKNNLIVEAARLKHNYEKDYNTPDKSGRLAGNKIHEYLEKGIYNLEKFCKEHPTYQIVGIEEPFTTEFEGKTFSGKIDRVFYDTTANTYLIQDIKTYAVELEKEKLATPLQFVVYTMAAKELYNCSEEQISCQFYLPFCNVSQDAGTKGYMGRGAAKLEKLFAGIDACEYTPSPSPLCNWCPFCATNPDATIEMKHLCPYYSVWERDTRNKGDIAKVKYEWQGLENHNLIMETYKKEFGNEGGDM